MLSHICCYRFLFILTDDVVKMADVIAIYLADVIAIVCEMVLLLTFWCYYLADVIAIDLKLWQMLKPLSGPVYLMADVIAICGWCYYHYFAVGMYYHGSWCYYYLLLIDWLMLLPMWLVLLPLFYSVLADVVAMVVDVKTTQGDGLYGRC